MKFKVNIVAKNHNNEILYQCWAEMKYSKLIRFIKNIFNMDDEIKYIKVNNDKIHFYARKRQGMFTFRIFEEKIDHNRITIKL